MTKVHDQVREIILKRSVKCHAKVPDQNEKTMTSGWQFIYNYKYD